MGESQRVPIIYSGQTLLSSSFNHTFFKRKEHESHRLESVLSVSFGPSMQQQSNFKKKHQIKQNFQDALIQNPYRNCPRILAQSSATRRSLDIVSSVLRSNLFLKNQNKEVEKQRFQQRLYSSLDAGYVKYKQKKDQIASRVTNLNLGYQSPITFTSYVNHSHQEQSPVRHNLGLAIERQKHPSSNKQSQRYLHCNESSLSENQFQQAFKAYNDQTGNTIRPSLQSRNITLNDFKSHIPAPSIPVSGDLPKRVKRNLNIARSFQHPSSNFRRTSESPYNHAGDSGGTRSHSNELRNHQSLDNRSSASSKLTRQKTPLEIIKQANAHYQEDQMILAVSDDKHKQLKKFKKILLANKSDTNSKYPVIRFAHSKLTVNGNSKLMSKVQIARRNSISKDFEQQTDVNDAQRYQKLINFNIDGVIQKMANRIKYIPAQTQVKKNTDKEVRFSEQKDIIIINNHSQ